MDKNDAPLHIFLCENMPDAAGALRAALTARLPEAARGRVFQKTALVKACVGSTVPEQGLAKTLVMEEHKPLYLDADALIADAPKIELLVPYAPFAFVMRRKLFVHNMGHALLAYLGLYRGDTYIHEVAADPYARLLCLSAMTESAVALARAHGEDIRALHEYLLDLMDRFAFSGLPVDAKRTGADPARKLRRDDRLVGAAALCLAQGVRPRAIAAGIAAGLYEYLRQSASPMTRDAARAAVPDMPDALWPDVAPRLEALLRGDSLRALYAAASAV
jgi:mannitol-1-phosphate 5-dehydrogenase